uniref:ABC transporter domain-containing protein n=1 Tax=Strigamia maritima TaxID=126957 RepID=T1J7J4_STRMM
MDAYTVPAVAIQQLHLNYGFGRSKVQILSDLNLEVETGTIYGILGPSGCGKTTLLRCVIGRLQPSQGKIDVFGRPIGSIKCKVPGSRVGYMPQELALYQQMSISETLNYFGRLHHMNKSDVRKRIHHLIGFLDLPSGSRIIQHLSGGQKRRVSFAVAILHEPPLLILDEPTVGFDPILRESLLIDICQRQRVTVVLTTHYIEEAREANKVGFMRNGKILLEDNPTDLLSRYNSLTLENVYHQVCTDDDFKEDEINSNDRKYSFSVRKPSTDPVITVKKRTKNRYFVGPQSLKRIWGLVIKNVHQIRRNPILILLQVIIPVFQIVTLFLVISSDPYNMPVAVYNEDNYMGTQYLKHINNHTVKQLAVDSLEEGVNLVANGKAVAAIHIWKNFSEALLDRLIGEGNVSENVIQASSLHLRQDTTNQQISFFVNVSLMQAFVDFSKEQLGNVKRFPQLQEMKLKNKIKM